MKDTTARVRTENWAYKMFAYAIPICATVLAVALTIKLCRVLLG